MLSSSLSLSAGVAVPLARTAVVPVLAAARLHARKAHAISRRPAQIITLPKSTASRRMSFSSTAPVERPALELPEAPGVFLRTAGFCMAKPESAAKNRPAISCHPDCGEDAYFICETADHSFMGVADGVGGWQNVGVDPSLFAWALMNNAQEAASSGKASHPLDVLALAYERVVKDKTVLAGSSTACIVSVEKRTGRLICANLGDSGFRLFRDGKVAFHTREQQHYFNAPYQLAVVPKHMRVDGNIMDKPEDADVVEFQVESRDLLLCATDGVFDNLFDQEMEKEMAKFIPSGEERSMNVPVAIRHLVSHAARTAKGETHLSPFAKGARAAGWGGVLGGKVDDVCGVLAEVR